MFLNDKLFDFKLYKNSDFIEIGGGEGDLSQKLLKNGFNLVLFVEPDLNKFEIAKNKLINIECLNIDISQIKYENIKAKSSFVTVVMQDVIEHITKDFQKKFFHELSKKYQKIYFIGRTPNLKSPFGLRNSFGDNSHLYRFTNTSLRDFLLDLGFENIKISNEPYIITGITSTIRYIPYLFLIFLISTIFLIVFGKWEGFLTPNIVFYSNKV